MPEGIGYGVNPVPSEDPIEELIRLAMDPVSGLPTAGDEGVTSPGLSGAASLVPNAVSGPVLDFRTAAPPSFEQGGVVGAPPAAAPPAGVNPAANQGAPIPPQAMQQEIQRMTEQHPEQVLQVKQAVTQALQTGELSPQELNMAVQLATAAAQNPQLYPQIRQFAIQQGLAGEADMPQEYDQGLVFVILLAAKAAQTEMGGQPGMPQAAGQPPQAVGQGQQAAGQPPMAALKQGGEVPESRNADGSVPITAHDGEGVLHAGVLKAKGTDFLNKLNETYELDGSLKQKA